MDGSVRPVAGGYVVTVRLVAGESGDELASYRETAEGLRELLPTLDELTRRLRGKIGESLKAVRATPALEHVTTPSLEALRKYVAGARANDIEGNSPKAIALLQEAVALDTTFAMAHRKLGVALFNAGMPREKRDAALTKAYQYRDRLTERERYLAIASYFDDGPGYDRQRAAAAYEALLERDSLDDVAMNNLGDVFGRRREFARQESLYRRAIVSGVAGPGEYGK